MSICGIPQWRGRLLLLLVLALSVTAWPSRSAFAYVLGTYYEEYVVQHCFTTTGMGFTACGYSFSSVPAGKKLVVTRVNCEVSVVGEEQIALDPTTEPKVKRAFLGTFTPGFDVDPERRQELVLELQRETQFSQAFLSNTETSLLYGPTQRPLIRVEFTERGLGTLTCVLTGEMTPF